MQSVLFTLLFPNLKKIEKLIIQIKNVIGFKGNLNEEYFLKAKVTYYSFIFDLI